MLVKHSSLSTSRRTAGLLSLALLLSPCAIAQTYPSRPVTLVVGLEAGGGLDALARLIAPKLSEELGKPVLVENRPGATGAIATDKVAKSSPDGHTLLFFSSSTLAQSARSDVPYDLERDLLPVSLLMSVPMVLIVNETVPAADMRTLVELGKRRATPLKHATSGVGGAPHLAATLLGMQAGIPIDQIPYKGGAGSTLATARGDVDFTITGIPAALPLMQSGKVRAISVTTTRRSPVLPAVPTMSEGGLSGYNFPIWYGVFAPAGTPRDTVSRVNSALVKVLHAADMKKSLMESQGVAAETSSPSDFAAFVRRELEQTLRIVKAMDPSTGKQ